VVFKEKKGAPDTFFMDQAEDSSANEMTDDDEYNAFSKKTKYVTRSRHVRASTSGLAYRDPKSLCPSVDEWHAMGRPDTLSHEQWKTFQDSHREAEGAVDEVMHDAPQTGDKPDGTLMFSVRMKNLSAKWVAYCTW